MIRFTCTKCKQRYKADESFAGEEIECNNCKTKVPIPHEVETKSALIEDLSFATKPAKEIKTSTSGMGSSAPKISDAKEQAPKLGIGSAPKIADAKEQAPKLSMPSSAAPKLSMPSSSSKKSNELEKTQEVTMSSINLPGEVKKKEAENENANSPAPPPISSKKTLSLPKVSKPAESQKGNNPLCPDCGAELQSETAVMCIECGHHLELGGNVNKGKSGKSVNKGGLTVLIIIGVALAGAGISVALYGTERGIALGILCIYGAAALITILGVWKTFSKAGQPGWAIFIPIYNTVVMLQIARKPIWWLILLFIPFIAPVIAILIPFSIASNFGKGAGFGLGLAFMPFIFYPILGFGDSQYQG